MYPIQAANQNTGFPSFCPLAELPSCNKSINQLQVDLPTSFWWKSCHHITLRCTWQLDIFSFRLHLSLKNELKLSNNSHESVC